MGEKKQPIAEFMMSPTEHRRMAFLLRQHQASLKDLEREKNHEALA